MGKRASGGFMELHFAMRMLQQKLMSNIQAVPQTTLNRVSEDFVCYWDLIFDDT